MNCWIRTLLECCAVFLIGLFVVVASLPFLDDVGHPLETEWSGKTVRFILREDGTTEGYYVQNGMKAQEINKVGGGTIWNFDGTVRRQIQFRGSKANKTSAPWWWGVQDQTEPTDPKWIAEHGKQ